MGFGAMRELEESTLGSNSPEPSRTERKAFQRKGLEQGLRHFFLAAPNRYSTSV